MVNSKYAKKFAPNAEIECVKCSKWLKRKTLPSTPISAAKFPKSVFFTNRFR